MAKAGIEVYQDKLGEWRWRHRAKNGKITCDGSEGYVSEYNARRAVRRTGLTLTFATIRKVKNTYD